MKRAFVCLLVFAVFAALPAAAASVRSIQNGIDVWHTTGNGSTFVDFDKNPIPKGFFCSKSSTFTGRVVLQGRPLATGTPGELGGADTIVQRLDDATFDGSGVATTRVQLRALQLESVAPIKTACGDFNVRVTLSGTQPTTKMKIIRETDTGGHFEAPIEVRFKIVFLPVHGGASSKLQIVRNFSLAPAPNATWGAIIPDKAASRQPTVLVDTDGDMIPDTYLPRTSGNFFPGLDREWIRNARERQAREKMTSRMPVDESPAPTEPVPTCNTTYTHTGYTGSYQCTAAGAAAQCHPEAEQAQHCAESCPPCAATVDVGTGAGTLN